jgi:NAD(P)-dependent dehydrogenase (short-subunit alcohol dehydrogenase family)
MKNLDQLEEADFDAMFDLNVRTATNTLTAVSDALVKGGAAVLVGSRAAVGAGGMSLYAASKAAVVALARSAALEWRHRGIRVNCILPDTIDTPANRKAMPDADFTRWAKPEQVAAVIAFLCSDSGTIITGAAIPVGYSVA